MVYCICTYFCAGSSCVTRSILWDLVNGRKLRPFKDLSKREFMTPLFFWKVEDFPDQSPLNLASSQREPDFQSMGDQAYKKGKELLFLLFWELSLFPVYKIFTFYFLQKRRSDEGNAICLFPFENLNHIKPLKRKNEVISHIENEPKQQYVDITTLK